MRGRTRPVPGWPQYRVDEFGNVYGHRGRLLKGVIDGAGYVQITLHNGTRRHVRIHQLVWWAFRGQVPRGSILHHRDGDPTNNRLSNLEVQSRSDHASHHHTRMLADPATVLQAHEHGATYDQLAARYGVSRRTVGYVLARARASA